MVYCGGYSVRQNPLGLFCFYNVTGLVAASFCAVLSLAAPFVIRTSVLSSLHFILEGDKQ